MTIEIAPDVRVVTISYTITRARTPALESVLGHVPTLRGRAAPELARSLRTCEPALMAHMRANPMALQALIERDLPPALKEIAVAGVTGVSATLDLPSVDAAPDASPVDPCATRRRIVQSVVFRRRPSPPPDPLAVVDPAAVPPAYRAPVTEALQARAQFRELIAGLGDGPLQERMLELGAKVDAGVLAVWRTASNAMAIDRVTEALDPERVTAELKQARRSGADQAVVDALHARFASTQRLLNARDELRDRLPVLEARLGTAVARAAELTLTTSMVADDGIADLAGELDQLVIELDALRAATAELR